jgi:hypothetical protein
MALFKANGWRRILNYMNLSYTNLKPMNAWRSLLKS